MLTLSFGNCHWALAALAVFGPNGRGDGGSAEVHRTESVVRGELGRKLDEYVSRAAEWGFSGTVLVAKDNLVLLAKGYGLANRRKNIPFTSDTPSCIGSITKQFTAAAILKLEMEGKLGTEDSIAKHLPGVPADKRGVTIYHLLTHTAGFPEYSGDDYYRAARDDTIRKILATPLAFEPGKQFAYSNAGYSTLAAIVERVAGQTYESYLHDRLLEPAGMANTGYRFPRWDRNVLPHGYTGSVDHGSPLDHAWSDQGPYWNLFGNGGIISTVGDMYRWQRALQGDTVLSASARKKLFTPFLHDYACGWDVRQTPHGRRIGHGGASDLGFNGVVASYEEGPTTVIGLCNSGTYNGSGEMSQVLAYKMADLAFGGALPSLPASTPFSVPRETLKRYEGVYELPSKGAVRVVLREDGLVMEPIGQDAVALLALVPDEAARLGALDKRAGVIAQGLVNQDYQPLQESARTESAGKRYCDYLKKRREEWEKRDGPVERAVILGTVNSWWDGAATPVSFVQIVLKNARRNFRLHWQDGKVAGIGGSVIASPATTPLRATGPGEFIGWHLAIAKPVEVRFHQSTDDRVAEVTLRAGGQAVLGRKKEMP
jgi:CubicO group peptidase (beta-lactamase class C family)